MRSLILVAALGACVALSACNTTTTQQLLSNLSTDCERHYDGAVSAGMTGGGFNGTVKIDCAAKAAAPATP